MSWPAELLDLRSQFKRQKAEAERAASSAEMVEWLAHNRVEDCATDITRLAGANVLPSDLRYLTDEDIDEIGSGMTRVEKMRLQAALQALREDGQAAEDAE